MLNKLKHKFLYLILKTFYKDMTLNWNTVYTNSFYLHKYKKNTIKDFKHTVNTITNQRYFSIDVKDWVELDN